ncbi:hypothetical protein [Hymenobacter sp. 5414T-23]|uniref:Ig-like domain-containing protein n=1 Tax=Hymenobacter sp. 5414T-23 TaxID=2932252 RepID=UPI00397C5DA1
MSFLSYLQRVTPVCLLVVSLLSSVTAQAQTKRALDPASVSQPQPASLLVPPGEGGGTQITLSGSSQVCVNSPASFTSIGSGCSSWYWEADGGTISQTTSSDRSTAVITWSQPGTYTVFAEAYCGDNSSSASRTITVVAPPTPEPIRILGNASQLSATSATICEGSSLELVPPAGSSGWNWTGTGERLTNGNYRVAPTAGSTTYTLTYTISPNPCTTSSSFTVKVVPAPQGPVVVDNTERFGPGPLTLSIKNANPGYVYSWYDTNDNAPGANSTPLAQGSTFTTPSLAQNKTYFVSTNSCYASTREEVPVTIRLVRITAGARSRQLPCGYVTAPP